MTLRCAGCGELWDHPTPECIGCGRPAAFNRIEWRPEYGRPRGDY